MNVLIMSWVVLSAAPSAEAAKLFSDKGSMYFRSDNQKALTVGAELTVVADATSTTSVGKAVIMEVSGKLARVSIDESIPKDSAKYVLVPKPHAAGIGAAPSGPVKASGPKLSGTLEWGTLRVNFANNSDLNWSACEIVHSDGRNYKVGEVVKHTDDAVLKVKLSSPPAPLYDHLTVSCAEGEANFFFNKPNAPVGNLKGYAVNEGKGGVVVYNSSESAWTRCDVTKPDRTHYVLGNLKGHADDSINSGRFIKEAEAAGWVELRCKEGSLHQRLE
jgi:hypothetical protein